MRSRVAWIGVGADRFDAEGPEPVIDDNRDRFTRIPVAPVDDVAKLPPLAPSYLYNRSRWRIGERFKQTVIRQTSAIG